MAWIVRKIPATPAIPAMTPPRLADRLLTWFCAPHLREEVLGDLHERYALRVKRIGEKNAKWRYWRDMLTYVRPEFVKRKPSEYPQPTNTTMLRNYLKIAFRTLAKHKGYSAINMAGLSVGMAVALLIGLWLWDELSFNKYHEHYDRIAQVKQHVLNNGEVQTWNTAPFPLAEELRRNYGSDFKRVVLAREDGSHILSSGDIKFSERGVYFEPQVTEMLSLKMLKGSRNGLREPGSILLSESVAKAFFGDVDPMNKLIKIDNNLSVKVTGVYEDLPRNSFFHEVSFMAPWDLYYNNTEWVRTMADPWRPNAFQVFVQLADQADFDKVSFKIRDAKLKRVSKELAKKKPALFLHPMSQWHLYSEFKDGVNVGGKIQYVWLFGIIGVFVLLLACINFMNLSTARSEKRAKEVGIRKAVGSVRTQLIYQFLFESLLIVFFSLLLALLWVQLLLPTFNEVADKELRILWTNPIFWSICLGFSALTGLIAGSYPAFYLSSFNPVQILKGTGPSLRFKVGRLASLPRQVLVVVQFTVSVTLIIGTIIVFRQIQFARNRPIGYESNGLISVPMVTADIHKHFDAVKRELLQTGAISEMAESSSPPTEVWNSSSSIDWKGKDPNLSVDFSIVEASHDYGKTIGWTIKEGRDFSRDFLTDSSGIILNEAAVKFMGLNNRNGGLPVGETIRWFDQPFKVIGVVKDLVIQSPYEQVKPTVFHLANYAGAVTILKINPQRSASEALGQIETVFKKFNPSQPFDYQFVDEEFGRKFGNEERIGKLASFFAVLAIFISCLGLFGLASFIAEQRTKEIGVRKVLGASVANLWGLLSVDFIRLVIISCIIATPIAYYSLHEWLQKFTYHTSIPWWIFAASSIGALVITLATVSFQAIKAALMNPVKSLRSE
ncbi:ABC transporter permease [Spirosoma sp. SC4-14]|uniref:ABC transporter permease n=1 Tax=Spirosoma sp. SC4-14 TaxID=3128900 RepID=UPI0030CAB788